MPAVVSADWAMFMPLAALLPDHCPLAVHDVGDPVALQERLGVTGAVPEVGVTEKETKGTDVGAFAVKLNEYVQLALIVPVSYVLE